MYKNDAVSLNEFSEAKNMLLFACTVKRQIANVLLRAEKKASKWRIRAKESRSNVIKQRGVVTVVTMTLFLSLLKEEAGETFSKDLGLLPQYKPLVPYRAYKAFWFYLYETGEEMTPVLGEDHLDHMGF